MCISYDLFACVYTGKGWGALVYSLYPKSFCIVCAEFNLGELSWWVESLARNRRSSEIQGTALGKCLQAWPVYTGPCLQV